MKFLLGGLLLFFLTPVNQLAAQAGCTDPQATNFDPSATDNDGSCVYPVTSYRLQPIDTLEPALYECSGVEWANGRLWAINDGGNDALLYQLDTLTARIRRTVVISNAENYDWEGITSDSQYLYIGDFGNNTGSRQNLKIYRIDLDALDRDSVQATSISFLYEDQINYSERINEHNFDCEAFFVYQDTFHLFTKNWEDRKTRHYVVPAEPGGHLARMRGELDVSALITAVDRDEQGLITLLGYDGLQGVLWNLFDYPGTSFFEGNKRRIELATVLEDGQVEGLSFSGAGIGFVGSEEIRQLGFRISSPHLRRFDLTEFIYDQTVSAQNFISRQNKISVQPNPFSDQLEVNFRMDIHQSVQLRLYDALGKLQWSQSFLFTNQGTMVLSMPETLPPGFYVLQISGEQWSESIPLIKH